MGVEPHVLVKAVKENGNRGRVTRREAAVSVELDGLAILLDVKVNKVFVIPDVELVRGRLAMYWVCSGLLDNFVPKVFFRLGKHANRERREII